MKNDPEKIGGILKESIQNLGFSERLHKQSAVTLWPEIVGEKISTETKALKIEDNMLIVKVYNAAWRQQMHFLKDDLLVKLETELGKGHINDIRFI